MGNQIFISYRRKDGFYPAYLLYKELIGQNFTVFFDLKSLRIGVFPDIIRQNIEDCTDFILIVSDSTFSQRIFQADDWVHRELALALRLNKNVVPVFVNGTIPDDLPEDIARIKNRQGLQQIDPNLISENYKKLIDERLVSKPQKMILPWKMRRCSAYDVNYGDEQERLAIQSNNAYLSDMNVLAGYGGGIVLDVGAAFGTVTVSRFSDEKYSKVYGFDRSVKCVEYANLHSSDKFEFFVADLEASDFRSNMLHAGTRHKRLRHHFFLSCIASLEGPRARAPESETAFGERRDHHCARLRRRDQSGLSGSSRDVEDDRR